MRMIRTAAIALFVGMSLLALSQAGWSQTAQAIPGSQPSLPGHLIKGLDDAPPKPPGASGQSSAVEQQIPVEVQYRFFFLHLANLDHVADKLEKEGKDGSALRGYEARAAGLSTSEESLTKQVAFDCNHAIEDLDARVKVAFTALAAFRKQHGSAEWLQAAPSPELHQLQLERTQIIRAHMDQLKAMLGDESFQKLDGYVHQRMKSAAHSSSPSRPNPVQRNAGTN